MPITLPFSPVVISDRREALAAAVNDTVATGNVSSESAATKKDRKRVSISESAVKMAAMTVEQPGSSSPPTPSYMERQFVRLQCIHQAHIQWHLSIEKYR